MLADAVIERGDVAPDVLAADSCVRELIREVARLVVERVLRSVAAGVVAEAKSEGMTFEHREDIKIRTLYGTATVPSPYMVNRAERVRARPVRAQLGLYGGMKTPAVERALTDFGAEESCALAAARFEEHYGQEVGRTSVLRVVKSVAAEAREYVSDRLEKAAEAFFQPIAERPGVDRILVELDGCMIRTGELRPADTGEVTEVRGLPKRVRDESWREVRVGFAREVDKFEKRYVAAMAAYEPVVTELYRAAVDTGMSERTEVYAVSDGGNGLREELDAQFNGLHFLLDRMHLKSHLHEAAEASGLEASSKRQWVDAAMTLIDAGHVAEVIDGLELTDGPGAERALRLSKYLGRFQDALDYPGAANQGLPVGSGEVESAHRYIPQKRLKIAGACWKPDTVNDMLGLRVLRANGWWQDFWNFRDATRRAQAA